MKKINGKKDKQICQQMEFALSKINFMNNKGSSSQDGKVGKHCSPHPMTITKLQLNYRKTILRIT